MYEKAVKTVSVLSAAGTTAQTVGSVIDLTSTPLAGISNRNMKLIVAAQVTSGTTPSAAPSLAECDTTDGTFAAVTGDTISAVTTDGVFEYAVRPSKRYVKATLGTPSGTGTPTFNIIMMLQSLKRYA